MTENTPIRSLFDGVRPFACGHLKIADLNHISVRKQHRAWPLAAPVGYSLALGIFKIVESNFLTLINSDAIQGRDSLRRSPENWRMTSPGTDCDPENDAREVGLERAIVAAFQSVGRTDWWNQVPVASGLFGKSAGKRRAIDLLHRRSPGSFDFVELKLGSNTPLYAAVEILEYGFAWLLSKTHSKDLRLARGAKSLLAAEEVHLSVLAPDDFYGKADYTEFGRGIDEALHSLDVAMQGRLRFDGFKSFPAEWKWLGKAESSLLPQIMDDLYPGHA